MGCNSWRCQCTAIPLWWDNLHMSNLIALVRKPLIILGGPQLNPWVSFLPFLTLPSSFSPEPRCSPPSSRSFSTLVSSASTRSPTRPPTALQVFLQSRKTDRLERTSAEPAPTRPRNVKTPTVSARPNRKTEIKKRSLRRSVVVFYSQFVERLLHLRAPGAWSQFGHW